MANVVYGAALESEISYFHKIWIIQDPVTVCGYIGDGTSKEIVSNWDAPFADSSLESRFRVVGGIVQAGGAPGFPAGVTSLTKLHSRQVWVGNQPYTFNLVLKLRAFHDPYTEVEKAIEALEIMMAPDLKGDASPTVGNALTPLLGLNRVPRPVTVNFGRRQILTDCCIRSMSVPQDKERDKNGYLIRADVSLQVETMQSITKTDLQNSRDYARH